MIYYYIMIESTIARCVDEMLQYVPWSLAGALWLLHLLLCFHGLQK